MYYCDPCAELNDYPESLSKSNGNCELCHKPALCNDVPCSQLPEKDKVMPDISISTYEVEEGMSINLPTKPLGNSGYINAEVGCKIIVISKLEVSEGKVKNRVYCQNPAIEENDGYTELVNDKRFIEANIKSGIFKST